MTLQRLLLKNFQCHSKLDIEFDEHVTTIVGPSDVGKSAIIRALKWLVFNKPSGDSFRKFGTKKTTVGLKFDGGSTLVRKKSDSVNEMELDGEVYKSFGTDVPEPISSLLNFSDINFQAQHDLPYWLSETAGQVSRELNAIVNLDVIDSTLKNLASALRKVKAERDVSKERLKEAEEEKDNLSYVTELSDEYFSLEKREKKIAEKAARLAHLQRLVEEASEHDTAVGSLRQAHSDGLVVVRSGERVEAKQRKVFELNCVINKAVEERRTANPKIPTSLEIDKIHKFYEMVEEKELRSLRLRDLVAKAVSERVVADTKLPTQEEVEEVERLKKECKESKSKYTTLETIVAVAVDKKETWLDSDQEFIAAKRELNDKSDGKCPLCGNEVGVLV